MIGLGTRIPYPNIGVGFDYNHGNASNKLFRCTSTVDSIFDDLNDKMITTLPADLEKSFSIITKAQMPELFENWGHSPLEQWADEYHYRYSATVDPFWDCNTRYVKLSCNIIGHHRMSPDRYLDSYLQALTLHKLWSN